METEKTIPLRKPVVVNDVTKTEISLREPVAGEIEESSKESTSTGSIIKMISLQTKWPRGAVAQLCNRDLLECSNFLGSFGNLDNEEKSAALTKTLV